MHIFAVQTKRWVRITVSTQDSQSCNRSSILLPSTRKASQIGRLFCWVGEHNPPAPPGDGGKVSPARLRRPPSVGAPRLRNLRRCAALAEPGCLRVVASLLPPARRLMPLRFAPPPPPSPPSTKWPLLVLGAVFLPSRARNGPSWRSGLCFWLPEHETAPSGARVIRVD